MRLRAYFLSMVTALVAVLGVIVAVNVLIDANRVYSRGQSDRFLIDYVRAMIENPSGVVMIPSVRGVKYELARQSAATCYVLGSSHEMTVSLVRMPTLTHCCDTLANLAVSGGTFEDTVALLGVLAQKRHAAPMTVFIGMGPWFFKHNADPRWQSLEGAYTLARRILGLGQYEAGDSGLRMLANVISMHYFQENVRFALSPAFWNRRIHVVDQDRTNMKDDEALFNQDGSLTYSRDYLEKVKAIQHVTCSDYKVVPPYVDPVVVQEFDTIVRSLHDRNIRVVIMLMPYHPLVWESANHTTLASEATQRTVLDMAARHNIAIIGDFRPDKFSLDGADFYDFMHMSAASLWKVH